MQSWLEQISQQCGRERVRSLVVISDSRSEVWQGLQPWLNAQRDAQRSVAQVGTLAESALKPSRPDNLLGAEYDHAIFDAHHGLYPDALAAISGTVKAGGLLLLLCPTLDEWPQYTDEFSAKRQPFGHQGRDNSPRFVQRLLASFKRWNVPHFTLDGSPLNNTRREGTAKLDLSPRPARPSYDHAARDPLAHNKLSNKLTNELADKLTNDQTSVLQSILAAPNTPHVITADRGRGKSYLLGKLAQALQTTQNENSSKDNGIKVWLTGPNRKALSSVFAATAAAAEDTLNHSESQLGANQQDIKQTAVSFLPPEEVLANAQATANIHSIWLLVDEAASLPIPLLMRWAETFPNIVFASTTHGYEGTGKGFQVRLFKHLDSIKPHWQQHALTQPIRYAAHDPLERWLFDTFLLDAEPEADFELNDHHDFIQREVQQSELANNPALLANIFSLLVNAHYQTKPSDLRDLLDAPGLRIFVQQPRRCGTKSNAVVSACLCTDEGPIEPSIWQAIQNGHRRPNGHLIPQSFGFYFGLTDGMALKCSRVIRIATQPTFQRYGNASALLKYVEAQLREEQYDLLGSSFAGTKDVLDFWQKNNFEPVKLGSVADHVSGVASALVVKSLSLKSEPVINKARNLYAFLQSSDTQFNLHTLPPLALSLLKTFSYEKGSVESALQILQHVSDVDLPPLPLNKNQTNTLRKTLARLLS